MYIRTDYKNCSQWIFSVPNAKNEATPPLCSARSTKWRVSLFYGAESARQKLKSRFIMGKCPRAESNNQFDII